MKSIFLISTEAGEVIVPSNLDVISGNGGGVSFSPVAESTAGIEIRSEPDS